MKKVITILSLLIILFGFCISLTGCGKEVSAAEKYGMNYYERADGKRIWYNTK